jgi:hypothetical protein
VKDGMGQVSRPIGDEDVERELRAYASARLSPDRFASIRMRAAVIERAHMASPTGDREGRVSRSLRLRLRRLAPVALVAAIAITAGTAAGVAAAPGGPLYTVRIQIETALLPSSGIGRADGQVGLLNERTQELTDAVQAGDTNAADAAADAYGNQVDQAISSTDQASNSIAQQIADLEQLRTTLAHQLAHFESIAKPNDKAASNLQKLIAKTQASIATIDAHLASLGASPNN